MKATAIAPANIAFIKYWGKADDTLRLPFNSSISMNLSECVTTTTVEFSKDFSCDDVAFLEALTTITRPRKNCQSEIERVNRHLGRIRKIAGSTLFAKVITKNSFPVGAGIASSASGLAALTVAAAAALGLSLSEKELSTLARLGSGSACRSIPDGFVLWQKGRSSQTSYAVSLYPHDYWELRDILVITQASQKKISTTEGMDNVRTSSFWTRRLRDMQGKIKAVKRALVEKDFKMLGEIIEAEAVNMHAVMMTQRPPLFYWNGATMEMIHSVQKWREEGVPVYFTIDAGPNVHLICEAKNQDIIVEKVTSLSSVEQIIINKPVRGAHVIEDHLF